jgi:hypothetical protein
MVTGTNPFDAGSTAGSIARILEADPPPIPWIGWNETAALGLDRTVRLCLRKRREERYQSSPALVFDLEQLHRALLGADQSPPLSSGSAAARLALPRHPAALWWWECHQVVASIVYTLMVYPAWRARVWIPEPWNLMFFFALLAAGATAVSVRLHLFFTSRSYPSELSFQRERARPWTRSSDGVFVAALLLAALFIGSDHSEIAALLLAFSVAATVSMLIIEPATARAAFGEK